MSYPTVEERLRVWVAMWSDKSPKDGNIASEDIVNLMRDSLSEIRAKDYEIKNLKLDLETARRIIAHGRA